MIMTTRFDKSLNFILKLEGGYTVDNGGPTNLGITQTTYNTYRKRHDRPLKPVNDITLGDAEAIYQADYWDACHCSDLPAGLDLALFDASVQHGPETAIKLLQRVLRVEVDGGIGPKTIAAAKAVNPAIISAELLLARVKRIYTKHERWNDYGKGWTIRLAKLNLEVLRQSI